MSGSLLLILAVWLLLMAPLLLRKNSPVRRTSQALSETRVLHEGGTELPSRPRRLLPAEGHYMSVDEDVDEDIEFVPAEPEYVLYDEDSDVADDAPLAGEDTAEDATAGAGEAAEIVDAELVEDPEDTLGGAVEFEEGSEFNEILAEDDAEDAAAVETEAAEHGQEDDGDVTQLAATQEPESELPPLRQIPTAYFRGGDLDITADTPEEAEEPENAPLAEREEESLELSEEDIAYIAARRGRGVYDPVASQKLIDQRLSRRKQVLSGLAGLTLITLLCSIILGGKWWLGLLLMASLTGVYLVNLRRQAIEEAKLRRRRLARMRRARLGVRNLEDAELGVADRLLRPGAIVVETDEADPELLNLEYATGAEFFDLDGQDADFLADEQPNRWDQRSEHRDRLRAV